MVASGLTVATWRPLTFRIDVTFTVRPSPASRGCRQLTPSRTPTGGSRQGGSYAHWARLTVRQRRA
jgi:hypothetical protein